MSSRMRPGGYATPPFPDHPTPDPTTGGREPRTPLRAAWDAGRLSALAGVRRAVERLRLVVVSPGGRVPQRLVIDRAAVLRILDEAGAAGALPVPPEPIDLERLARACRTEAHNIYGCGRVSCILPAEPAMGWNKITGPNTDREIDDYIRRPNPDPLHVEEPSPPAPRVSWWRRWFR